MEIENNYHDFAVCKHLCCVKNLPSTVRTLHFIDYLELCVYKSYQNYQKVTELEYVDYVTIVLFAKFLHLCIM